MHHPTVALLHLGSQVTAPIATIRRHQAMRYAQAEGMEWYFLHNYRPECAHDSAHERFHTPKQCNRASPAAHGNPNKKQQNDGDNRTRKYVFQ